ncbi:magnesium transporter [Desulfonatronum thiosulfatophilum]|uniref:Magnesium transport protein CorA n=1 Tax=Desulfonatronum thiosulfatophilum TaxID=617002 RepID=A0A1G6AL25_9BACT|nr:magnesium/cobalt transporter CorA [Desulfonatronum thiosulfatophilum]SDB09000.1 magnesium transporter [Desulfonatronum thiosulfatophilum]
MKSMFIKSRHAKVGAAPGTLVHVGEQRTDMTTVRVMAYDAAEVKSSALLHITENIPLPPEKGVLWINVDGLHQIEVIKKLGHHFDVPALVLEDVLNTDHRPKLEIHDDFLFIVVKMLVREPVSSSFRTEQLSLILGDTFLLSFQELDGDVFDPVRTRINDSKGRIRASGPDYLAYALLDAVVDNYFMVLENISTELETLEESLLTDPSPSDLQRFYRLRREAILLRRVIWPVREALAGLMRDESARINPETRVFFRDIHDHAVQAMDIVESLRDLASSLLELHLSRNSQRMNETIKVLTLIATIFIPLTFIAGVYGMNFDVMPELHWTWGYPLILLFMLGVAVLMLFYFKRKKWL